VGASLRPNRCVAAHPPREVLGPVPLVAIVDLGADQVGIATLLGVPIIARSSSLIIV